jgi:hypothetical protein
MPHPKLNLGDTSSRIYSKTKAINYRDTLYQTVFIFITVGFFLSSCRKPQNTDNIVSSTDTAYFSQQGLKLVGLGASQISQQGLCTSLSSDGNTLAIGGHNGVWIFTRSNGIWAQLGNQLLTSGEIANSFYGGSLSLSADGNTLAIGTPFDNGITIGAVLIFTRNNNVWVQQGSKLVGTGAIGYAYQGGSVSLSSNGNTLAVGGPTDNKSIGAVWIFRRNNGAWTQQGNKLVGVAPTSCPQQGSSVSLSSDGNAVAVGCQEGAWIYRFKNNLWEQQGSILVGSDATDIFQGECVSLSADGNTLASGAPVDNGSIGAIWIFTCTNETWTQQGSKLVGTGVIGTSYQGNSISLGSDGNILVVGGYEDNNEVGATWVFTRENGVWHQQGDKLIGSGAIGNAIQGTSVAISEDGKTFVTGGNFDNNSIGAVWVFNRP